MQETSEYVTDSATADSVAIAFKELEGQLQRHEAFIRQLAKSTHNLHQISSRYRTWQTCNRASCIMVQIHLKEGTHA